LEEVKMAEWGGYSLLDEAMKLKMAEQAQGFTAGPSLTTGVNPSTAAPAISPELMQFGEKIGDTPASAPELSWADKLGKGIQSAAPALAEVGTALMRGPQGRETAGSQVGSVITGALKSQKLNEALKKMVGSQLAGGGSFTEGQPVSLSGADVVGLTPEQITGLYGTGLKVREAELKRPFENIATISDAYLKVMQGEAKPAEMEAHLATAQKAYQEIAAAPVKNLVELLSKMKSMEESQARINEIQTKIAAAPVETAKKEAETEKTKKETKKLELESKPEYTALKKRMETEYGTKLEEIRRGDKVSLVNPISGKEVMSYSVSATPETEKAAKTYHTAEIKFATSQIAPYLIPVIQADMAKTPSGKRNMDLAELLSSLRPIGGGEIDPAIVKALAAKIPGLSDKLDKAIDAYISSSGNEEFRGGMIRSIIGVSTTSAQPEKPAGKKSIIEKNKPAAAAAPPTTPTNEQFTKQLTGKPAATYTFKSDRGTEVKVVWDGSKIVPKTDIKSLYPYGTY
jgi:hypothetical protein